MPKAILEFQLPEEKSEYTVAFFAPRMYSVLLDLDRELRDKAKYSEDEEEMNCAERWRRRLWDLAAEEGIPDLWGI